MWARENASLLDLTSCFNLVTTQNLLADDIVSGQVAMSESEVLAAAQALLAQAKTEINLIEGDIAMAALDVPNLPPQYAPVMITRASQAELGASSANRTIGICQMISNPTNQSKPLDNGLSPVGSVRGYFRAFEHQVFKEGATSVTVLVPPAHGTLEDLGTLAYDQYGNVTRDTAERKYRYRAEAGYVGQDSVTFLVEKNGYKVKVIMFLHVFGYQIRDDIPLMDEYCPNGESLWKISTTLNPDGTNTLTSVEYQSPTIAASVATADINTQQWRSPKGTASHYFLSNHTAPSTH